MLLVNKTKSIIQIAEVHQQNSLGSPTLIPIVGSVEIDDARWEKIKKGHKVIAAMLDEGMLEEIKGVPKLALSDMKPRDAIEVVTVTVDMNLLKSWKSSEKRKMVANAIANQIKRLNGEAVEENSHSEDDGE